MEINLISLGARIKYFRNDRKLSQEALAEIVSVNNDYISRIENGHLRPSLTLLISIANALEVSVDDLLVDSLSNPNAMPSDEIHELLLDCNENERAMLIRTAVFLKAMLSEFGI